MACEYVILKGAQDDYQGIVEYLLDVKKSPQAALGFVNEFDRQLEMACDPRLLYTEASVPV